MTSSRAQPFFRRSEEPGLSKRSASKGSRVHRFDSAASFLPADSVFWNFQKCYHAAFKVLPRLRPLDVFRLLRMDYVSRQFINLTKKFRKELRPLLSKLDRTLDKQTAAIRENTKAKDVTSSPINQFSPTVNLPESIEIHQREDEASQQRNFQSRTLLLSFTTFLAVAVYAALVYLQYREMISATDASQQAVVEARRNRLQADKALNATIEQFHLDQRAWIGMTRGQVGIKVGELFNYKLEIKNTGKTPALDVQAYTVSDQILKGTLPPHNLVWKPEFEQILHPGQENDVGVKGNTLISQSGYDSIKSGHEVLWIRTQIRYRDVFSPTVHRVVICSTVNPDDMLSLNACPPGYQSSD
jgi:hypothetical protein